MPVEPLAGKIVIDTNNYYPQRDGHIPELDDESTTTSELLQAHLPTSKVVKAFNHIYAAELTTDGQPAGTPNRRALVIAGDDAAAKATVTELLESVRFRRRRRRAAERGLAHPARHAGLRPAAHGRRIEKGPGRRQALPRSVERYSQRQARRGVHRISRTMVVERAPRSTVTAQQPRTG